MQDAAAGAAIRVQYTRIWEENIQTVNHDGISIDQMEGSMVYQNEDTWDLMTAAADRNLAPNNGGTTSNIVAHL